jgi:hypothetical protein
VADLAGACYRTAMSPTFESLRVRRASLALCLVVLLACGETVSGDIGAAPDSAAPPQGSVEVSLHDISFTACRCHHGFAPGIDGAATVHVVNAGARVVTLVPGAFVLRNQTTGAAYTTRESESGSGYYSLENVPGSESNPPTPPSFQPALAPGGSTEISVSFYIDDVKWPVAASLYELEVDLGVGVTATSAPFALTEGS